VPRVREFYADPVPGSKLKFATLRAPFRDSILKEKLPDRAATVE